MSPKLLTQMFTYNHYCLKRNVEGITAAESLFQPRPGGNCLNWIVGHILATRNYVFFCLKLDPVLSETEALPYKRGSEPLNPDNAKPWAELLEKMDRSQEQLISALTKLPPEALQTTDPGDTETLGEKLVGLHFHEAYHIGQTGILRRLLGKPGAIQ